MNHQPFVSRAGAKLAHGLEHFNLDVTGFICADFGCNAGGFVDCFLQNGAKKVYAVDTGYGVLDWKLRNDERVVVMERTNALRVELPEKVDMISIDVSWTKQEKILPVALSWLKPGGKIISLLKPHYEADEKYLRKGKLAEEFREEVVEEVIAKLKNMGINIAGITSSPILGKKGGNVEYVMMIYPDVRERQD